jgi:hypothetical protein
MSDPENFLSRWSRRKRTAAEQDERIEPAPPEVVARDQPPPETQKVSSEIKGGEKKEEAAEPAFDLSKLPSLESITAETDIRAFLAPGIPAELTRAALRRAWAVDPKIRDFIEIAENQWDFTAAGVPGFDLSPPTGDVARMVAEIFGGRPASELAAEPTAAEKPDEEQTAGARTELPVSHCVVNESATSDASQEPSTEIASASPHGIAERAQEDAATQQDDELQDEVRRRERRTHGRAVPR